MSLLQQDDITTQQDNTTTQQDNKENTTTQQDNKDNTTTQQDNTTPPVDDAKRNVLCEFFFFFFDRHAIGKTKDFWVYTTIQLYVVASNMGVLLKLVRACRIWKYYLDYETHAVCVCERERRERETDRQTKNTYVDILYYSGLVLNVVNLASVTVSLW